MIVWRGLGGALLLLGLIAAHVAVNFTLYRNYTPEAFDHMNFWLPSLIGAGIALILSVLALQKVVLLNQRLSLRDGAFFIPLPAWVPILLGLAWWAWSTRSILD